MDLSTIIDFLHQNKETLHNEYNIDKIGVFGSYAKHEEKEDSDIDFFVKFSKKSYRNLAKLYNFFEKSFERKIDIVTEHKNMRPALKREIESSVIYG